MLIESLEEARNIMDESRLQNVKQVFSINPKKAGAGVRFTYGAEGGMNSNPIEPYRETRMRADMREKIKLVYRNGVEDFG